MKKVKLLIESSVNESRKGEITDLYSIEEIRNIPNISVDELGACEDVLNYSKHNIAGFIRSKDYIEGVADFIQMYGDEIEFVEEDYII